jgi:hypothetical protein
MWLSSSKNEKYFRQICRENQNKHFIFHNFPPELHDVYEIMWKNMIEPDRPQMAT